MPASKCRSACNFNEMNQAKRSSSAYKMNSPASKCRVSWYSNPHATCAMQCPHRCVQKMTKIPGEKEDRYTPGTIEITGDRLAGLTELDELDVFVHDFLVSRCYSENFVKLTDKLASSIYYNSNEHDVKLTTCFWLAYGFKPRAAAVLLSDLKRRIKMEFQAHVTDRNTMASPGGAAVTNGGLILTFFTKLKRLLAEFSALEFRPNGFANALVDSKARRPKRTDEKHIILNNPEEHSPSDDEATLESEDDVLTTVSALKVHEKIDWNRLGEIRYQLNGWPSRICGVQGYKRS